MPIGREQHSFGVLRYATERRMDRLHRQSEAPMVAWLEVSVRALRNAAADGAIEYAATIDLNHRP